MTIPSENNGVKGLPLSRRLARLLAPPPRYKISEFAEEKAFVPFKPEEGKYHLDRMPWQKDMLDDPLDPAVNEIYWQLARRMGKSICICIICEYFICHVPSPILVVYPTIDAVKKWFRGQLLKMVAVTPCMQNLLLEPRTKGSDSTMLDRHFPGGDITGIGANSPAGLRSLNKRIILQEEIDAFENTSEGDAVSLADGRADNFHNAVKLKTSTPGTKGESRIESGAERGDGQYFYIPCAHCGEFFAPKRENLRFSFATQLPNRDGSPRGKGEIRDTANARLVCPHCEWELTDQERMAGIRDSTACWKATRPFKGIRSRHLNGMYRIMGRKPGFSSYLHEFSELWLEHKHGGQETIRVFVNNFDAETWEVAGVSIEWSPLRDLAKKEDYFSPTLGQGSALPPEVTFITAGLDVHPDRVEIGVYGWGVKEECWALEHDMIIGDLDQPEMQSRVAEFLDKRYEHPFLGPLKITCAAMDSGYQTKNKAVYSFCKAHRARNVWPTKGSSNPGAGLWTKSDATKRYGIALYILNTDTYKDTIFERLEAGVKHAAEVYPGGPRYFHFHSGFTVKFFKMLCSEKKKPEKRGGMTVWRWVKDKSNTRNEALDCLVGAMGAYDIIRPGGHIEKTWKKLCADHPELVGRAVPCAPVAVGPDGKKTYPLKMTNVETKMTKEARSPNDEEPSAAAAAAAQKKKGRGTASLPRKGNNPWRRGGFFNPLGL